MGIFWLQFLVLEVYVKSLSLIPLWQLKLCSYFWQGDISDRDEKLWFICSRIAYGPVQSRGLSAWDVRDKSWVLLPQLIYIRTIPTKNILLNCLYHMMLLNAPWNLVSVVGTRHKKPQGLQKSNGMRKSEVRLPWWNSFHFPHKKSNMGVEIL